MGRFRAETVTDIGRISDVIKKVDELVSSIAASIEEQNVTTRDIARNVEEINRGVSLVNRQVVESASISKKVTGEMADLNQLVDDVGAAGESIRQSAEKLSLMTEQMVRLVEKFEV